MENINEFKKRFNQLLESTIGNVKPLVNEQDMESEIINCEACFETEGFDLEMIPESCKNVDVKNPGMCSSEMMKGEFYQTEEMMDKVDAALDCMMNKIMNS